jgi:hypothetical protein
MFVEFVEFVDVVYLLWICCAPELKKLRIGIN